MIQDGEVRNAVESVLDGAEDVLSFLFTNSGSALRRVKAKERKRRVNGASKEGTSNPTAVDHTADCTSAAKTDISASLKSPLFSSQVNNKDFSQWTPLSLSDVQTKQVCVSETSGKVTDPHVDPSVKSDEHKSDVAQLGRSASCTSEHQGLSPGSCHEKSQGQSFLLEASPALTFTRKPRKFVYRVQNSDSKRFSSVTGELFSSNTCLFLSDPFKCSNTDSRLSCLLDAVAGKHYQESSPRHNMDAHTTTGDGLVQPAETTVEQDHPASLTVDHDLDMSQLCKAFSEDFTQEVRLSKLLSARSSHDGVLMPTCTTIEISEIQPKTESVIHSEGHVDHRAAVKINLTSLQSLESTPCDSGCPTGHSGFSLESPSCTGTERHSGFKTANNKIIAIPPEALMKAKAALDEPLEHMTPEGTSSATEPTKANTNQSNSNKPAAARTPGEILPSESYHRGREAGRESPDDSVLRSEAAAENLPSTFMCQTNESGFKTASNKSITVSSENLKKAKGIFLELAEEELDSWLSNNRVQVCSVKDAKPSEVELKSSLKPSQHSTDNDDRSSSLTASQRADVTELCSILEEAGSQCEFTQLKHAQVASKCPDSMQFDREWDPEMLAGIDFDDSFNYDVTERQVSKKHQSKLDARASAPRSLANGDVGIRVINPRKSPRIPLEKPNLADNNQEKSFCFGFKTANGNAVTISEKCLSKARSLFADIEEADAVKPEEIQAGEHQDSSCRAAMESEPELKPRLNLCNGNASSIREEAEVCKQMCSEANLETLQGPTDQKPDFIPSKAVYFGFSTAGGKQVKVSEKALQNAKKLLNEAANDEETKRDDSPANTKASPWTSVHDSFDVLADVLQDSETSDGFLPKSEKEQHFETSPDTKQASVSASAIQKSKSISKDVDDGVRSSDGANPEEENAELDLEGDTGQHAPAKGFKMVSGKGVSFSEKAFMKAKTFFRSRDPDCVDVSQVKGDDTSVMDDRGFEAVAGNAAHLSGTAGLNKETLKKDSTDLNKYVQRKFTKTSAETLRPPPGCGFSTASGAAVSVSAQALQRAKAMLDDSDAASPGERRLEISEEKSISKDETGKTCGFSTASGRRVAISEKALHKAKSLFTDCDADGLGPDPGNLFAAETSAAGPERTRSPFSTANNTNLIVSDEEINNVFVSCDDVPVDAHHAERPLTMRARRDESCSSEALSTKDESMAATAGKSEARYENMMNGGPKADPLGSGNFGFGAKGVRGSNSALEVASETVRDRDAQPVTNAQSKITNGGPSTHINDIAVAPKTKASSPSLPWQASLDSPSLLNCHSLNLHGCTVTQQLYFEQEAMACTKALLEDDLSESALSSRSDAGLARSPTLRQERRSGANAGTRKRTSDDEGLTCKSLQL